MKKLLSVLAAVTMLFTMAGCSDKSESSSVAENTSSSQQTTQTESKGGFKVDGTKLLDANGNEFVMRGINSSHSWFADYDYLAFPSIAQTGSNTIRVVCSNGLQYTKDSVDTLKSLVEQCKENKMIAVLEVHDGTGDDSLDTISSIADYWVEMKDALIGNEDYVILNIANEWVGTWESKTWRDGYVAAIPKIREAGIKNTIMVDSAGWGQYAKCIADYGMEVFNSDTLKNTMFSVHMYGSAGKNEQTIENSIKYATDQGLCIVVGEFGYKHSDGDVDEAYIMKYCTENNIGYLGWSWKGNGGGVEYLDISVDWEGANLSADWGENLINGENGIKATSKICSIFE